MLIGLTIEAFLIIIMIAGIKLHNKIFTRSAFILALIVLVMIVLDVLIFN